MTRCSMMLPAPPVPSSYEEDRQRQIAKNRLRLQQIGFCEAVEALRHQVRPPPPSVTAHPGPALTLAATLRKHSASGTSRQTCGVCPQKPPSKDARRGQRTGEPEHSSHGDHCVLPGLPAEAHTPHNEDQGDDVSSQQLALVRPPRASLQCEDPDALRQHNYYRCQDRTARGLRLPAIAALQVSDCAHIDRRATMHKNADICTGSAPCQKRS